MCQSAPTAKFGGSIARYFLDEVVPRHRDTIASADERMQLTYDELGRACLLACLAAGRPCVPIDPSYPAAHIEAVIRDAGIGALITEVADTSLVTELPRLPMADAMTALV